MPPYAKREPKRREFHGDVFEDDYEWTPEVVDLSLPGCGDRIAARENPEKWHFPDINSLCMGMEPLPW